MTEEEKERLESAESVLRDYHHAHPDSEKIKAHFDRFKPVDKVREGVIEILKVTPLTSAGRECSLKKACDKFREIFGPLIQEGGVSGLQRAKKEAKLEALDKLWYDIHDAVGPMITKAYKELRNEIEGE